MSSRLLTSALCAASLAAQSPVSPSARATTPGNAASALPFGGTGALRYQELHSSLPPNQTVRGMSWRQNEGVGSFTGTQTLDMELAMGLAVRADIVRFSYASNYSAGRTVVMARRIVNMGPQGLSGSPAAFRGMAVAFDAPFVFTAGTLGWDAKIHAKSVTGSFAAADAEMTPFAVSSEVALGTGCRVANNQNPMVLDILSIATGLGIHHANFVRNAPTDAPLVLALGASNPNLPVPGLCTNLHTDVLTTLNFGSTDNTGAFAASGNFVLRIQRDLTGQSLFSQVFALDPASTAPIPLVGSNGVQTVFATPASFPDVSRIYTEGNPEAVVAPFAFDCVGVGLVTRFDT